MPSRAFSATPPEAAHLLRPVKSPSLARRLEQTYFGTTPAMQWRIHCRQAELLAEKGIRVTPEECMASFWQALLDFFNASKTAVRKRGAPKDDVALQSRLFFEAALAKTAERVAHNKEKRSKKYILFLSRHYPLVYHAREKLGLSFREISILLADYFGFAVSLYTLRRYYNKAQTDFPDPPLPETFSLPDEFRKD